jgi:hypothetical protein
MPDLLVDAIYHILHDHGPNVLYSPKRFESLLSERVRPSADRTATLAAVTHGTAAKVAAKPEADLNVLCVDFASQAGLTTTEALRTLERWRIAVEHLRTGTPPFSNKAFVHIEEKQPPSPYRRGMAGAILVALVGTIAGALPGLVLAIGVTHRNPTAQRVLAMVEERQPPGTRMTIDELALWSGALGGAGGLIGGAIGWLAAGFRIPTNARVLGAACGALWAFDGAVFGVMALGLPGLFMGSMIATTVMSFFGAAIGWWAILLLLKPLAWFIVPHF